MTKPILTLIAVLLALTLGLVAGVVIGRESVAVSDRGAIDGVEPASNVAPVTVEAEEGPDGGETQPLLPEARPAPQPLPATLQSNKIEGLAFDGAAHLARLPWELDELVKRAEGGDGDALAAVVDWLKFCSYARGIEAAPASSSLLHRGDVAFADVRGWIVGVSRECQAWGQRHALLRDASSAALDTRASIAEMRSRGERPPPEVVSLATQTGQVQARAVASGHAGARADTNHEALRTRCDLNDPDFAELPARDRTERFERCRDEERLRVAELQLGTRDPIAIAAFPDSVGIGGGVFFPDTPVERRVLWTLTACAFGLDCGPSGRVLRWACIRGVCGYASYHAYAADQLVSPAAMRRIERLVPELVRLIRAGDWAAILAG